MCNAAAAGAMSSRGRSCGGVDGCHPHIIRCLSVAKTLVNQASRATPASTGPPSELERLAPAN